MDQDQPELSSAAQVVVEQFAAAPGAAVGAAIRVGKSWLVGYGAAGTLSYQPDSPPVGRGTFFDLASLTKPLVALTAARCQRHGWLDRGQRLAELLPWLAGTWVGTSSLDLLLAHRAGLLAHREFFIPSADASQPHPRQILAAAAEARRPECLGEPPPGGFAPIYSDLGYMLAGAAAAEVGGQELDELVKAQLCEPLGLRLGSARQLALQAAEVAPTEHVAWRGGLLRGVVHDENAWILAGTALAGHAGAFGDVQAVVELGTTVLDCLAGRRDEWLSAAELGPLVAPRPGGPQCAGFELRSGAQPTSGAHFGPRTFGHLGFTGTSLWMDPDRELVGVLLCNRVHPSRQSQAIRRARPAANDQLFALMSAAGR